MEKFIRDAGGWIRKPAEGCEPRDIDTTFELRPLNDKDKHKNISVKRKRVDDLASVTGKVPVQAICCHTTRVEFQG